jgi:hypothetical protein
MTLTTVMKKTMKTIDFEYLEELYNDTPHYEHIRKTKIVDDVGNPKKKKDNYSQIRHNKYNNV